MFNIVKQVINFNDILYIVKRIIKEEHIKAEFVQEYKDYLGTDIILKKDNLYFFANKIEEAEIIEYL